MKGRILAIDYGLARCGIAVTDPEQIICKPLQAIETKKIMDFLKKYCDTEMVIQIVLGMPYKENGEESEIAGRIKNFRNVLHQAIPNIPIAYHDERYTSRMAQQAILMQGLKKKQRQDKGLTDATSAALILQSFLESHS